MDTRTYTDRREYNRAWRMANRDKVRSYERDYYASHPEWRKNYSATRYAEGRRFVDAYKLAGGCVDCGYKEHACALDFDHRDRATKLFTIAEATQRNREVLLAEMEKCDVRCRNCHAVKTKLAGENGPHRPRG